MLSYSMVYEGFMNGWLRSISPAPNPVGQLWHQLTHDGMGCVIGVYLVRLSSSYKEYIGWHIVLDAFTISGLDIWIHMRICLILLPECPTWRCSRRRSWSRGLHTAASSGGLSEKSNSVNAPMEQCTPVGGRDEKLIKEYLLDLEFRSSIM